MEEIYHYIGLVIFWALCLAVASIVLIAFTALIFRLVRKSWIYSTYEVAKTWYYYDYKKSKAVTIQGLNMVEKDLEKGIWYTGPYKAWWTRFIARHRAASLNYHEGQNEDDLID